MDPKLLRKLEERSENGAIRKLTRFEDCIDFVSNDYFGLSTYETPFPDLPFGSTGSRLISGNSVQAENAERFLAEYFHSPAALVFNSGYAANLGLISAVAQRNDTILYDEFIHASIRDGIRLSTAKAYSFKHNSIEDLEKKMKLSSGAIYIIVEGLYSMNGDFCPLQELVDLAKYYKAYVILDEAHSAGVIGPQGKGMAVREGMAEFIFARVITFGKAFGSHGACVLGSEHLIKFLVNFSRPFIYTTALPPRDYFRIEHVIKNNDFDVLQKKLHDNIRYFWQFLTTLDAKSSDLSPIQMFHFATRSEIAECINRMTKNQLAVKPIFAPTVPDDQEGIRICIHSFDDQKSLEILSESLNNNHCASFL